MRQENTSECAIAFTAAHPAMERQARYYARKWARLCDREEFVADTLALSWRYWRTLWENGRQPADFPTRIAQSAARHVRAGQRIYRKRFGGRNFYAFRSPAWASLGWNVSDGKARPDAVAAVRIDYAAFRLIWSARKRAILDALLEGDKPREIADRIGWSKGHIERLRHRFRRAWFAFTS